jgi:hypothetical protein
MADKSAPTRPSASKEDPRTLRLRSHRNANNKRPASSETIRVTKRKKVTKSDRDQAQDLDRLALQLATRPLWNHAADPSNFKLGQNPVLPIGEEFDFNKVPVEV